MTVRAYMKVLWRHRLVFLATSLLGMAVGSLLITLAPPTYSATAHLYFVARGGESYAAWPRGRT